MGEPEVRVTDPSAEVRKAGGFELARQLRHQEFRDYLAEYGWELNRTVIMCASTDPVTYLLDALEEREESRAIVAIPDADHPHGFRLATIQTPTTAAGEP